MGMNEPNDADEWAARAMQYERKKPMTRTERRYAARPEWAARKAARTRVLALVYGPPSGGGVEVRRTLTRASRGEIPAHSGRVRPAWSAASAATLEALLPKTGWSPERCSELLAIYDNLKPKGQ